MNTFRRCRGKADPRGGRIVAVIECILNQNARDPGAATCPAMNVELLRLCAEHDVGIVQMPCPEKEFLGYARQRPNGVGLRDALDTSSGRACCRRLAEDIACRLADYACHSIEVVAVLGGNARSPGCAVIHASEGELALASGIFMQELSAVLRQRGLRIPFRGMRDAQAGQLDEDLAWLASALQHSARRGAR